MKRKNKVFAVLIAAMLIASLCCAALVACNNSDKSKSNGGDDLISLTDVMSQNDLESMIGFAITEGSKEGVEASFIVSYVNFVFGDRDLKCGKYGTAYSFISFMRSTEDGDDYFNQYTFDSASAARAYFDDEMVSPKEAFILDGKNIYQGDREFFTNTVLKGSIPADYSRERLAFIREREKENGAYFYFEYSLRNERERCRCTLIPSIDTNCLVNYQFSNTRSTMNAEEIAEALADYADDSYYDFERENGYVFSKLTDKPGFKYMQYESSLSAEEYYYDKNSPKDVVVPAQANGKSVLSFGLDAAYYGSNFSSPYAITITLSEGIVRWNCDLEDNPNLVSISLPSSLRQLPKNQPIGVCPKFSTIEYAGTIDEWNALVEENNVDINSWCNYCDYDENYEPVRIDITITVKCTNGNLTYPTAG